MKYRKKPVVIEAFQFYVDNMPDWFMDAVSNDEVILYNCDLKRYTIDEAYCRIRTLEGWHWCNGGDYVIKGVKGELYPCKADIFNQTYEEVKQMTKIEELEQKLNEASSGFEFVINEIRKELVCYKTQKELKESKKEDKWEPALNKLYWYRGDEGINLFDTWENDEIDEWRRKNLKIFETEEQCEKYWKFMDAVKEKSYTFSKEEWRKHNIRKYTIYYDFKRKEFGVDRSIDIKYLGEIYFKTEEDCQYIIDNFKEELMEYFL